MNGLINPVMEVLPHRPDEKRQRLEITRKIPTIHLCQSGTAGQFYPLSSVVHPNILKMGIDGVYFYQVYRFPI